MKILLLRPYYGINVHSDMHGDLGTVDCYNHLFPDFSFVMSATIASQNKSVELLDVIDANAKKLLPKDVLSQLKADYDLIIIKAAAPSVKYDLEFVKGLKKRYPQARLVLAGHIAKVLQTWIRNNMPEIDDICCEPLEYYMYKLLNQTVSVTLNDLPSPDYSLFPYQEYLDADGVVRVFLHTSRGCVVGCSYCPHFAFYGKNIDTRSVAKVIEDIKQLVKLGIRSIEFKDQFFTMKRQTVIELCQQIIDNKLDIKWRCQTRLESLDHELIDLMVQSGFEMIFFGVESASSKTLKSFNRPANNVKNMKELVQYLNDKGVITIAFYIIGFPDDTWDNIEANYQLSTKLKSHAAVFFIYNPYLLNDPNYATLEITPDLFGVFDNPLTINVAKNLTIEQLKFLEFQLPLLYKIQTIDLEIGYEYQYRLYFNYTNDTQEKLRKLSNCSIFDL